MRLRSASHSQLVAPVLIRDCLGASFNAARAIRARVHDACGPRSHSPRCIRLRWRHDLTLRRKGLKSITANVCCCWLDKSSSGAGPFSRVCFDSGPPIVDAWPSIAPIRTVVANAKEPKVQQYVVAKRCYETCALTQPGFRDNFPGFRDNLGVGETGRTEGVLSERGRTTA